MQAIAALHQLGLLGGRPLGLPAMAGLKGKRDDEPYATADQEDVSESRNADPPAVRCPPPSLDVDGEPQDGTSYQGYCGTSNAHVLPP
jgi:hypothetical protein